MDALKIKVHLYIPFFVFFSLNGLLTYSQEEFYGKHNGLTITYLKALNENANAVGISTYLRKGFILGIAGEEVNEQIFPSLSLVICPNWHEEPGKLKVGFGPSYTSTQYYHAIGFNIGFIKRLFTEENFPFSVHASVSPNVFFSKKSDVYKHPWNYVHTETVIGCGYTQAFFAKSYVYPFIGISYAYATESKNDLFSAMIGVNFRLD